MKPQIRNLTRKETLGPKHVGKVDRVVLREITFRAGGTFKNCSELEPQAGL